MIDVHRIVTELTSWHQHRQPYTHEHNGTTWETHHTTQVPPLITQLAQAQPASQGNTERTTPASRPTARIDALDTLVLIDLAAARWVRDLGEDDPGDTITCIRKLYGLTPGTHHCGKKPSREGRETTCCTQHQIHADLQTWWTQARITTGWDTPAWAPNNTCPMCSERRTLRIRVDDQAAMCLNCRETWSSTNIGLLAEHVRAENGEELVS